MPRLSRCPLGRPWKSKGKGKKKKKKSEESDDLYALIGLKNERWTASDKQIRDGAAPLPP